MFRLYNGTEVHDDKTNQRHQGAHSKHPAPEYSPNDLLCSYISRQSSLNAGEINNVLKQLQDAILFFTRAGHSVKLDELGTFTPTIRLDGSYNMNVRIDRTLIRKLNRPGEMEVKILNRKNIGLSADDLIAQWNDLHPDDLVV